MDAVGHNEGTGAAGSSVVKRHFYPIGVLPGGNGAFPGIHGIALYVLQQNLVQVGTVDGEVVGAVSGPEAGGIEQADRVAAVVEDVHAVEYTAAAFHGFFQPQGTQGFYGVGRQTDAGAYGAYFGSSLVEINGKSFLLEGNGGTQSGYTAADDGEIVCFHG
jgi:hypothetical protein